MIQGGTSPASLINATLVSGSTTPVTFSASGLPTGVTANFTNNPCTPTCSVTVSFSAAVSAAAGTSTVTIDAVGGGVTHSTTLSLTVVTPRHAVQVLIDTVIGMGLSRGVTSSLIAPLRNAADLITAGNLMASCPKLSEFIRMVDAYLANGQLTVAQANELKRQATLIKASIGCP
ncbi:MAG TPA: hypothetical protein VE549_14850 [Myxococcaceae bacterium]|nr:hypothetical protein [Myxococcaceae bacterium]